MNTIHPNSKIVRHIFISGLVQGVGFRYNLKYQAVTHQVTGWCRNRQDGRVEAILYGIPDNLELVLDWCHSGPTDGRVDQVFIQPLENPAEIIKIMDENPSFEIKPTH